MSHPDIHRHLHAARAAELRAQARTWKLLRTAGAGHSTWRSAPLRGRLGWLLIEAGLRLLCSRAPAHPAEG